MAHFDFVFDTYVSASNLFNGYIKTFLDEVEEKYPFVAKEMGIGWGSFVRCQRTTGDLYHLVFGGDPASQTNTFELLVDSTLISKPNGPEFHEFFGTLDRELKGEMDRSDKEIPVLRILK